MHISSCFRRCYRRRIRKCKCILPCFRCCKSCCCSTLYITAIQFIARPVITSRICFRNCISPARRQTTDFHRFIFCQIECSLIICKSKFFSFTRSLLNKSLIIRYGCCTCICSRWCNCLNDILRIDGSCVVFSSCSISTCFFIIQSSLCKLGHSRFPFKQINCNSFLSK